MEVSAELDYQRVLSRLYMPAFYISTHVQQNNIPCGPRRSFVDSFMFFALIHPRSLALFSCEALLSRSCYPLSVYRGTIWPCCSATNQLGNLTGGGRLMRSGSNSYERLRVALGSPCLVAHTSMYCSSEYLCFVGPEKVRYCIQPSADNMTVTYLYADRSKVPAL